MVIEILYVPGCPGRTGARIEVEHWLRGRGQGAEVREVEVKTAAQARRLRFRGSPTIRIDGRDAGPAERVPGTGVYCRLGKAGLGDGGK